MTPHPDPSRLDAQPKAVHLGIRLGGDKPLFVGLDRGRALLDELHGLMIAYAWNAAMAGRAGLRTPDSLLASVNEMLASHQPPPRRS